MGGSRVAETESTVETISIQYMPIQTTKTAIRKWRGECRRLEESRGAVNVVYLL